MKGLFKMECVLCPLLSALLVLLSSSPECNGQDTVKQAAGEDRVREGHTHTLICNFTTSTYSNYLFWYRQKDDDFPKYIKKIYLGKVIHSPEFDESKFGAEVVGNSLSLKMEAVDVTDSAVYYCALQPTLTGNTNTLNKNLCSKDNTIVQCLH
uniref:Ig-like domain-containing protein n=1 Tax=Knipowitschia caucasica TaxID=637954 RepID=A0AAV2JZJ0_KNICA